MRKLIFFACAVLFFASPAFGDTMYVQSAKAKLMESPSFKAGVVAELTKGTEVSVLETQKRWQKISAGSRSGWVSKMLLAKQPPLGKVSVFKVGSESLEGKARRRASSVTTAGAARGLSADDRRRAASGGYDYFSLKRVEANNVTDAEIAAFISEGELQ